MTDKVQKIREEVEKCYNKALKRTKITDTDYWEGKADAYRNVLVQFDSMQEEHVSIDFEQELYKAFGQVKDFTLGMRIAKWFYDMGKKSREPVSENLEEAVNAYIGYAPEVDESSSTYGKRQAFKAGAQWQKTKDESTTKDLCEYINELSKQFPEVSFAKLSRIAVRVAKWQKEQMEKEAIDGYVIEDIEEGNGDFLLSCEYLPKNMGLVDQQKIKVIVIKEN